jgi:phosphate transport system substrate-binding protein
LGLILGAGLFALASVALAAGKAPAHHPKAAAKTAIPAADSIIWRGDHCTARIFKDLARQYEATKQGSVTLQPFSTISGLDAVNAGTADVAGSARAAMPERAEEKSINFYPIAWDALVPIVSADNPVSNISLKQLHDLYLGRIDNWKDLGGPDAPINLYGAAPPLDGIEYSTRLLLFHYGDQTVSVPRLYVNTEKLEEGIAIDVHGIGMSTLSGVAGNRKIKMLSVEGYSASTASVADGTYPLYTALYLASREDDKRHDAVAKFIHFVDSDSAKAILRKHDLVPYADASGLLAKQEERVAFIDAHVFPQAATTASSEARVSAPNATAQALQRVAPTSELTAAAKDRAAQAKAGKDNNATPPAQDNGGH